MEENMLDITSEIICVSVYIIEYKEMSIKLSVKAETKIQTSYRPDIDKSS